jgi:glycogenin glucosyltransferase
MYFAPQADASGFNASFLTASNPRELDDVDTSHHYRADFEFEKNPDARLEQLRRSSLVEIEHLTKDPHPDPPLRALPEHSVLQDEETSVAHSALGGGGELDGTVEQKDSVRTSELSTKQLEASGIARIDFGQSVETSSESVSKSGGESEGLFFTSQGLSAQNNASSSTSHQSLSFQHSSTTEQTSSSSGQQIQSGKMTFTLPDFGKDVETKVASKGEDVLSPTQAAEELEVKKGQGLF